MEAFTKENYNGTDNPRFYARHSQISFVTVNSINTKSICFNEKDPIDLIRNFADKLDWHKNIAD